MGIKTDDLIIHPGRVADNMMREHPYMIVQIPRLGKEIVVCDQVGEITFVGTRIHDPRLYEYSTKNKLKEREDIVCVVYRNDEQWWGEIKERIFDAGTAPRKKVTLSNFARKKPPLEIPLIKQCIYEYWKAKGEFPSVDRGTVEYGPYAGHETWGAINVALHDGGRGLPKDSGLTLAALNEQVSDEYGLDYQNHMAREPLDIEKIKQCIYEYYKAKGKFPSRTGGLVEHGPYKGQEKWSAINSALENGCRGLPKDSGLTLSALNQQVSDEYGLDYQNHMAQEPLDIDKIKQCIYEYYKAKGKFPGTRTGLVEYGFYAGQEKWLDFDNALRFGGRGLPKDSGLTLTALNQLVAHENGFPYKPHGNSKVLNIEEIKQIIKKHFNEASTGSTPHILPAPWVITGTTPHTLEP